VRVQRDGDRHSFVHYTVNTLLDMAVAFFSGMAAAYCMGRPTLSAALPGVAIAAALLPPIATTGIALAIGEMMIARGAALLFMTNVVAIILGAAFSLYAGGVRPYRGEGPLPIWVRGTFLSLILTAAVLAVPLGSVLLAQFASPPDSHMVLSQGFRMALAHRMAEVHGAEVIAARARMSEGGAVIDVDMRAPELPGVDVASDMARISREFLQVPVRVRLHPQLVVEAAVRKESEIGASIRPDVPDGE
jgi:hypothetical protein